MYRHTKNVPAGNTGGDVVIEFKPVCLIVREYFVAPTGLEPVFKV